MEFYIIVKRGDKFEFDLFKFRGKAVNVLMAIYDLLLRRYQSKRIESYWVYKDIPTELIIHFMRKEFSEFLCKLIELTLKLTLNSRYMFNIYRIVAKLEDNKIKFWIATGKYMIKIEVSKNNEEKFEEYKIDELNLYELRPGYLGLKKILEPKLLVRIKEIKDRVVKNFDKIRDLSNFESLEELFKYLDSVYMMM